MDNKSIRKANVEWLVREHGGPTELGKLVAREQVQVSQWLGGKPIGDRLARDIETKLGKPPGWLDMPHFQVPGKGLRALMEWSQAERLDAATIARTAEAVLFYKLRRNPRAVLDLRDLADAGLFADALQAALEAPEGDSGAIAFGAKVADLVTMREAKQEDGQRDEQDSGRVGSKARKARASR